ncbi:MAG: ATP-binding protein [Methylovulum sp.]|uniref:AAA family ATPase n=1 Tax=Methylovulum sp. TaxID=1916980 RepID=UPI002614E326|nr:ATP-binding protein [Methylovulum sp.]MDD2722907.1 ATP-binding protein [Methylovulum sp.]MDD5124864.1 ATP-binding protein [Methylovulum sp.]
MKFKFEQLGPLYQAEVELADLTIICGENNTGKTYVTNSLYALLVAWQQLLAWDLSEEDMLKLHNEGFISINLQKEIVENWAAILQETMTNLAKNLHEFLATPPERFNDTKFSLTAPIASDWINKGIDDGLNSSKGKRLVSIKKQPEQTVVEIAIVVEPGDDLPPVHSLASFIRQQILEIVLGKTFPDVFITSAERTGSAIFRGELNFSKNKLVNVLTEMDNDKKSVVNFSTLLRLMKRSYALSVEHNVEFISIEIPNLEQRGISEVMKNNPALSKAFKEMAGGSYKATKEGAIYFTPKGTTLKLGLGEASSAVRSLMVLWFWLHHEAKTGDMLMIDEPELNLHPANQRRLARFLAALVNAGIKIFLTTHSDYIIREFNTLIMLSSDKPHLAAVREKFKAYTEGDFLKAENVAVYTTTTATFEVEGKKKRGLTLQKWDVKQHHGIQVKSFDDEINAMNQIQDAILYGVS